MRYFRPFEKLGGLPAWRATRVPATTRVQVAASGEQTGSEALTWRAGDNGHPAHVSDLSAGSGQTRAYRASSWSLAGNWRRAGEDQQCCGCDSLRCGHTTDNGKRLVYSILRNIGADGGDGHQVAGVHRQLESTGREAARQSQRPHRDLGGPAAR